MPLEDQDDIEFNELLQEKRHKELLAALKGLTANLTKKENVDIRIEGVSTLEEALKNFSLPTQDVNVSVDIQDFVSAVRLMSDEIKLSNDKVRISNENLTDAINNRLLPDTFTVEQKEYGGKLVKVNYKKQQ